MDRGRLYEVCAAALEGVADYYDEHGGDLKLPARRFVSPGPPAWDCPLAAVYSAHVGAHSGELTAAATPQLEADPAYFLRAGTLSFVIVRPMPVSDDGSATDVDDEDLAARRLYADLGTTWDGLVATQAAGELPGCGGLAFLAWDVLEAQGGLVGSLLQVAVTLE